MCEASECIYNYDRWHYRVVEAFRISAADKVASHTSPVSLSLL